MSNEPVSVEILTDDPERDRGTSIHPMAAGVLIIMDGLWSIPELAVPAMMPFVVFGTLLTVLPVTFLIQKYIRKDDVGPAAAKAAFLAVLAAVPFPVIGTATGLLVLGMAGLHKLRHKN